MMTREIGHKKQGQQRPEDGGSKREAPEHNHKEHRDDAGHSNHETMFRNRFWVSLVLTVPVLLFSKTLQEWINFSMPAFPGSQWIGPGFSMVVFFYGGLPFLRMAIPELKERRPGMMTLISLAIITAFGYSLMVTFFLPGKSFFWEMTTLIDMMLLGHWIEMRSVRRASGALDELAKLMPDTAERLLPNENVEEVSLDELKEDDRILVRPGANIPVDGVIEEGETQVDQSMITGESKPIRKEVGDQVIGGTINSDGSLRVRVTATGDQTSLAGIMRLVEDAQQSKSNTQLLADRAAGWLFYIALSVAAITGAAWIMATGFQIGVLQRVVTVLVIACPHALGLAIPLVVAISTSLGATSGILVRDRPALEAAREIDTVIFDKTGTLTMGEFGVVEVMATNGWDKDHVLGLAAAAEGDSEHMIARGIRREAERRELSLPRTTGFEAIKGRGIKAKYDGQTVYVGGPRLLDMLELDVGDEIADFTQTVDDRGQTAVYLIVDGQFAGAFAIADTLRPESIPAVTRLQEMGIEIAMLTGDSEAVAKAVAKALNIDSYFAEVLPEHKDQKIGDLQQQGKKVAMVGDGINDAPALARADVGIAIGSGTDVAVESAGIILVQNNPLDVVRVIALSRATHRKMVQNLVWATGYNVIALPLAAGVLAPIGFVLSPAIGAILMSLSTVVVAVNAQLLRRTDLAAGTMV
ncbi:MAG: heavy metal translocating P-type ATPase [Anaerolineae bacterium]|nr:heavy metal translocating P-type ATPase [Anaerolineae bacterium]